MFPDGFYCEKVSRTEKMNKTSYDRRRSRDPVFYDETSSSGSFEVREEAVAIPVRGR